MGHNWSVVTDKIYGIVKGSCKKLTMYDKAGNETIDPDDATRFFGTLASHNPKLDNFAILVALHDRGQYSYINIKTPNLKDDVDFKKVHQIRNHIRKSVGQKEGIKVVWQVFDKEIDPKEEAVNNIKESKDVGKWFGTTKSSFQRIGEAKLIIRHTDAINEEKTGARTRHIRALFVENKTGERFAYPHLHMSGARAFARHISNGGTNYDSIAEGIISLSADYISLRRAAHTMRQHQVVSEWTVGVRKSMDGINRRLTSLHGSKGYSNAESILASQSMVLDEQSTDSLWQKLSEECSCGQHDPAYADLGVAAKYLGAVDNQPTPITFSWHRKPNIAAVPDNRKVLERLHWQIRELADACADPRASARLSEIAGMIASNIKPTDEDLNLVREAIASSSVQSEETVLPEEVELDEFLNKFSPEAIFAEDPANADYGDNADITENYDRLKTLKKLIADIERKEKQLPPGISAERKKLAVAKEKLAKEHHRLFVSQFGDSLAEEDHGEPTKDDIIWCSNCGERFHGNGRKHGFSHCENHKGFKMIYETLVTDDENVDEGDAYGVAQKDRERKEEIVYNKEQRAKRWNFGEPIKDDTAADSDLEEDTADENINEGWSIAKPIDTDRYQSRAGLEGPFMTKVGKVVYYDPKEGKYYDPDSDFYIDYDDYAAMNEESSVGSDNPCHVCDGSGTHRGKTCRLCDGSGLSSAGHHSVEEAESDIRFIPGVPGEAILKIGNYYLVWDRDRYESRTVKNEYDVYQQTGDTFKHIENLNMPYDPPGHATAMFIKKYSHMTESENIKRIKHLAGI